MAGKSAAARFAHLLVARRDGGIEFGVFLGSVVALQGTRFLFTLVAAAGLPPPEFIAWTQFVTLVAYAPNALLGISNGMNRAIPIHLGRGEPAEADSLEGATWGAVAAVIAAGILVAAVLAGAHVGAWLPPAIVAGSATVAYQVQQFALRSRLQFGGASAQQWISAALTGVALLWVVLVTDRSLTAVLWTWTFASMGAVAAGFVLRRPVLARASVRRVRHLMVTGFPIMVAGLMGTLLYTADRWVASARLDATSAGSYGLASLIASAVFLVPMVIAQQQYPRLAILHGRGATVAVLRAAAARQSAIAAAASVATGVAVGLFTAFVVEPLLPEYRVVVPVVILSAGVATLAATTGYANMLVVVGRLWTYVALQLIAVGSAITAMWIGSGLGSGPGIALGLAFGQVVLLALVVVTTKAVAMERARE